MNAIRLAAGIVIASLVSTTFHSAMGDDVVPLTPASMPDFREFALVADAFDRPYFSSGPAPSFYFQTEALLFQQVPRFGAQPIVVNNTNNTTLMSTSNLNSTFNPGLQAMLGRRLQNGQAVELEYLGLFGGSSSAVAVKPGPAAFLTFPNNLAGNAFVDMNHVEAVYFSSFNSFAINLFSSADSSDSPRGPGGCCGSDSCCDVAYGRGAAATSQSLSGFAGFRYINFNDELNISTQRVVGGVVENGSYRTTTSNDLYGAQLGGRYRRTAGRFGWDSTGFAGLFGSDVSQTQSATDFPNFPLRPPVTSNRAGVAFVGGGSVAAIYALNSVWNLRAGYTLLWVEGLALAPNQLDFNFASAQGGSHLRSNGGVFLHGATTGLEARW